MENSPNGSEPACELENPAYPEGYRGFESLTLRQPLIAKRLNAVTGISLRYHSSIVYHVDMTDGVPSRAAFRTRTETCDRCLPVP